MQESKSDTEIDTKEQKGVLHEVLERGNFECRLWKLKGTFGSICDFLKLDNWNCFDKNDWEVYTTLYILFILVLLAVISYVVGRKDNAQNNAQNNILLRNWDQHFLLVLSVCIAFYEIQDCLNEYLNEYGRVLYI